MSYIATLENCGKLVLVIAFGMVSFAAVLNTPLPFSSPQPFSPLLAGGALILVPRPRWLRDEWGRKCLPPKKSCVTQRCVTVAKEQGFS